PQGRQDRVHVEGSAGRVPSSIAPCRRGIAVGSFCGLDGLIFNPRSESYSSPDTLMKPAPISSPSDGRVMPSAIDLIGRNPALQEHWIRRFFAGLIDGIIVAAIYLLFVLPLAFLGLAWYVAPLLYGVVWVVYS